MTKILKFFYQKILDFKVSIEGGQAFSKSIRKYYSKKYNIKIGYGSYGGCFHYGNIPAGVIFGNYCSIAQGLKIFRANHPVTYFTMHPLFYNPTMGYVNCDMLERLPLIIGHDVWIGTNVIILPGCYEIGNGAVIGAGSIVTKNVLPYAIIAGNPAKLIKMRFTPDIIEKLEATEWWNMKKEELIQNKERLGKIVSDK
jgi:acetyltransferase-like isoleucine patch superfamily enzyme